MSANVEFDIRVRNFGANKASVLAALAKVLQKELPDEFAAPTTTPDEIRVMSDFPVVIGKSYDFLPDLRERLAELESDGITVELRVRIDSKRADEWEVVARRAADEAAATKPAKKGPKKPTPSTSRKKT
ncbi:MAG: hypothetical protein NT062_04075 [Proteobacteria bacterium]|nr:hypothetical protein [Pseudomonadota bacterium]